MIVIYFRVININDVFNVALHILFIINIDETFSLVLDITQSLL